MGPMPQTPQRGRPRLSAEDVKARILDYCRRYGVKPGSGGLPPFPSGQRETPQHRDWMAVYKAHQRLARASGAPIEERRSLLAAQDGACGVCRLPLGLTEAVVHKAPHGRSSALHPVCQRLTVAAEAAGPEAVEGLRVYLWPTAAPRASKRRP